MIRYLEENVTDIGIMNSKEPIKTVMGEKSSTKDLLYIFSFLLFCFVRKSKILKDLQPPQSYGWRSISPHLSSVVVYTDRQTEDLWTQRPYYH